jgi:putative transposase
MSCQQVPATPVFNPYPRSVQVGEFAVATGEGIWVAIGDKIVAMYARGMTMREIQGFLLESYAVEVSAEFISSVTDAVMEEVGAWQARPLEPMYPVVFFDALRVKIREDAVVRNKAIYLALGVRPMAHATSWACGSRAPRVPSSG